MVAAEQVFVYNFALLRRTALHGFPQRFRLGPTLFNLYCLPVAEIFKRHNVNYRVHADDTQRYAECPPSQHSSESMNVRAS